MPPEIRNFLLLGSKGAGKTTCMQSLVGAAHVASRGAVATQPPRAPPAVVPTNGVEHWEVPLRDRHGRALVARVTEVGGAVAGVWRSHAANRVLHGVLLCVDVCNAAALPDAATLLYLLLAHEQLRGTPIALLLCKTGGAAAMPLADVHALLGLPELAERLGARLAVMRVPAAGQGAALGADAVEGVRHFFAA